MIKFYVIDDNGDKFLRRSTDEFGEYSFEPVDNIDAFQTENLVKAKFFSSYDDCDEFIGTGLYVLKVKGYRQNYQLGVLFIEDLNCFRFLCPNGKSAIDLDDNSIIVFWKLSTSI